VIIGQIAVGSTDQTVHVRGVLWVALCIEKNMAHVIGIPPPVLGNRRGLGRCRIGFLSPGVSTEAGIGGTGGTASLTTVERSGGERYGRAKGKERRLDACRRGSTGAGKGFGGTQVGRRAR
jgi:hypothetical protein